MHDRTAMMTPYQPSAAPALTPADLSTVMGQIYARGDRLMTGFVCMHLPIAFALAMVYDTWVVTIAVAPAATLAFVLCVKLLPRTFFTRCMAGVILEVFCALHIYQMWGQPEQHFWFFIAFTMMLVYQDWLAMWPGALFIIIQHFVFAALQNAGYPMHFFPDHHVGFLKLFFHFGLVIVHVAVCNYWAVLLRAQTLRDAQRQRRLEADIAERRRVEEALRLSEERTRLVIDTALDAVVVVDDGGRISGWNPQAETMFGWRREEVLGHIVTDVVFPAAERERHWQGLQRLMASTVTGVRRRFEITGVRRGGAEFPLELTLAAVPGGNGVLYSGFIRDLTEQHRVADERQRLETRMRETQQRESLGVLAGGIAHDFNNLLVGILGNAGLVRLDLAPESPVRGTIEDIEAAARRASDLANQMLAYAGKGKLVVRQIRVSSIVQEMAHLLGSAVSRKAVMELRLDDTLPPVEADCTQLRQVIMNLITNASEALEDRPGVIAVTTRLVEVDAEGLTTFQLAEGRAPGRYVALEVADSGKGMDPATLPRIFDPFFTTKFTGRGLGLASVLGIVRSHHGLVRVESRPGRGTTFTVLLPPAETVQAAEVASAEPPAPPPPSKRSTVLVVDDEAIIRQAAGRILERGGYQVITACDGLEGIEQVRRESGRIDAVLLDLTMPQLGGEDTLTRMRRIAPDLPVVLTSGYSQQEIGDWEGPVTFLAKPYKPEDLYRAIRTVTTPD